MPMRLVVLGNPNSRRVAQLEAALAGAFPSLTVKMVAWAELIRGTADLREIVCEGDIVRIDSPGKDFEVERLLLGAGASACAKHQEIAHASPATIEGLVEERGRILWPGQWYRGFCSTLERVAKQLAECPPHLSMNDAGEIQIMFDKVESHARLRGAGVAVAPALGAVRSFDELMSRMRSSGCGRVFVKLAYGSSASGTIAIRTSGGRMQAFTTVELDGIDVDGRPKAYNTRRIREIWAPGEIGRVVNEICRHRAQVERWLPKAGIQGRVFDLRVVVIAGEACHTVARLSSTPMTNLHLLNKRGDVELVRERAGEAAWAAAMDACERAARVFQNSLYAGIDLLFTADFRRHAVLEINAFGDQLPGVMWRGMSTQEAQIRAMMRQTAAAEVA